MGNSRFLPPFSDPQIRAAAVVPKVAAFPSIVGSLFLVQHIMRNSKRREHVYHRILLAMSVHDVMYSVKAFVSTWPIPKGTPFVYGAVGTTETCTIAGFFGQAGSLTSIFYNGSLTLFFLLVVRFKMKDEDIQRNFERWLHFVPLLFGWSTAIAGLFLKLYNAFGWTCWINSYPSGCIDNDTCERGDNAGIFRWVFFHGELWLVFGLTVVGMVLIYRTILKQERIMDRYVFRASIIQHNTATDLTFTGKKASQLDRKKSTSFAMQATLYVVVFFLTWFFPMVQTLLAVTRDDLYYPLILLSSILSSLQGFSNAVIYLRPRWLRYRAKHPDVGRWQTFLELVVKGDVESIKKSSDLGSARSNTSSNGNQMGSSSSAPKNFKDRLSTAMQLETSLESQAISTNPEVDESPKMKDQHPGTPDPLSKSADCEWDTEKQLHLTEATGLKGEMNVEGGERIAEQEGCESENGQNEDVDDASGYLG